MAMRGINKVILIGNLGADPEVRYLPSGDPVANLRVATSEVWKDRQSGEQQERTEWHSVALFGKTAEVARDYLRKGSKVYLEGKLRTRKWQGQDGQDRYTTEVIVDINGTMQMLDTRSGASSGGSTALDDEERGARPGGGFAPSKPQRTYRDEGAGGAAPERAPSSATRREDSSHFGDEDIPF